MELFKTGGIILNSVVLRKELDITIVIFPLGLKGLQKTFSLTLGMNPWWPCEF